MFEIDLPRKVKHLHNGPLVEISSNGKNGFVRKCIISNPVGDLKYEVRFGLKSYKAAPLVYRANALLLTE